MRNRGKEPLGLRVLAIMGAVARRLIRYGTPGFERRYKLFFEIAGVGLVGLVVAWLWLMTRLPPGGIIGALAFAPGILGVYSIHAAVRGPDDA